jgi:hypothetical protein
VMGNVRKDDTSEPSHAQTWRRDVIMSIGIMSP